MSATRCHHPRRQRDTNLQRFAQVSVGIFLVLFTLKIFGAGLSWWVVTCPLWGPAVLLGLTVLASTVGVVLLLLGCAIIDGVATLYRKLRSKLHRR